MRHEQATVEPRKLNGSHGLIGHNSAAAALDDAVPPLPRAEPAILSIADMAARAAAIHRRHVEAQRRNKPGLAASGEPPLSAEPVASERTPEPTTTPTASRQDKISIADLVARAAAIQRRHVDENRKALTALTIPAPVNDSSVLSPQSEPSPAPAQKKALRKAALKAEAKARRKAETKAVGKQKSARKGKRPKTKHEEAR
jgi:hypothetical protein